METPVVIALIAAAASILAAILSYRSSATATRGAHSIASLNHRVAALDAEVDQFREDYRQFMAAMGSAKRIEDVGVLLAAGEILQANPRCTEAMIENVDAIRGAVQAIITGAEMGTRVRGGRAASLPEERFVALRHEFRGTLATIADERASLMAQKERAKRRSRVPRDA